MKLFQPDTALLARYAEPQRHYHSLPHIQAMLALLRLHGHLASQPEVIEAAIWFHDAIYDTHRQDNEEASAQLAQAELSTLGWPQWAIDRVMFLVRATSLHDAPIEDTDAWLLLDLDLAVLAQGAESYEAYAQAIRCEYAWVPEAAYKAGRAGVLERFLQRDAIYRTPALASAWEATARANVSRELSQLQA